MVATIPAAPYTILYPDGTQTTRADTTSLREICQFAFARNAGVRLGRGRFVWDLGPNGGQDSAIALPTVASCLLGSGRSTEIEVTAQSPAVVNMPDLSGYPTGKQITTESFAYFHALKGNCPSFEIGNFTFLGHTGTPVVSDHYTLFRTMAQRTRYQKIWVRADVSQTPDTRNGIQSAFKSYEARGFLSCIFFASGEDPWVQPLVDNARGITAPEVSQIELVGEPLQETDGVRGTGTISFAGQPADGNTVVYAGVTFEFDSNGSVIQTSTLRQVVIGGDLAATMVNLIAAINVSGIVNIYASQGTGNVVNVTCEVSNSNGTITKVGANITVTGLTGGTAPAAKVIPFHFRKCADAHIGRGIRFGERYDVRSRAMVDYVLIDNPANNDNVLFQGFNPYTGALPLVTLTWKTSAALGSLTEVQIGATKEQSILNLVDVANRNRVDNGGGQYVRALRPSQYMPGDSDAVKQTYDGTVAACRFETLITGETDNTVASKVLAFQLNALQMATTANNGAASFRNINATATGDPHRRGRWMFGFYMEDCFGGVLERASIGNDYFDDLYFYSVASGSDGLFADSLKEAGHKRLAGPTGELNVFGNGCIGLEDAGWNELDGMNLGLGILLNDTCGMLTIKNGNQRASQFILTGGGNVSDGDKFTIADGNGGSKAFEWDNNAAVAGGNVAVTIGANLAASMENARRAIRAQVDLHNLRGDVSVVTEAPAGTFTLIFTYATRTRYSTTSSITVNVNVGGKMVAAAATNPWKPRYNRAKFNAHAWGNGSAVSRPYVWAENIQERLDLDLTIHTMRGPSAVESAQAVRSIAILDVPPDNAQFSVQAIGGGGPGTLVNFIYHITAGKPADDATHKYIDTTINATLTALGIATAAAVNTAAYDGTNPRSFGAENISALTLPTFAQVSIYDGTVGVNTLGASVAAPTVGGAGALIILNAGAAGHIVLGPDAAPGNASADGQGVRCAVVLSDCVETHVDLGATLSFNNGNGAPVVPIYAKASVDGTCKVHVRRTSLGQVFGRGRKVKGAAEVVVLRGAHIATTDVLCPAGMLSSSEGYTL